MTDGIRMAADDDHAQAARRGQRLVDLADACILELLAGGLLPAARCDDARVALFTVLCDDIYGNAAVDIPRLRRSGIVKGTT